MAETDGSLKLGVDFDISPAEKSEKILENQLKNLGGIYKSAFGAAEQAQNKATSAAQRANEAVKKQEILLESLKGKYAELENGSIAPKGLKQLEADISRTEKELNKLIEAQIKAADKAESMDVGLNWDGFTQAKAAVEALDRPIEELAEKLRKLQDTAEQVRLNPQMSVEAKKMASEISLAEQKLSRLKSEASQSAQAASKVSGQFKKVPAVVSAATSNTAKLGESVKRVFTGLNAVVKKAFSTIGRISKSVFSSVGRTIRGMFANAKKDTSSFTSSVSNMFARMKSVILSAFVFNVISKSLSQFTAYIGNVIKTNEQFMHSLRIVKGNLMAAFQPLIDVVMPLLTMFGQALVKVTGYLAQFVSLLTGKNIGEMYKGAKSLSTSMNSAAKGTEKTAKGTEKAAKATKKLAKEVKSALAGFDELNVLPEQTEDTIDDMASSMEDLADASGDMGAADNTPIFEPPQFDLPEWVKEIIDAFKQLNFMQAGKLLADALMNALDSIDWRGLGQKVGQGLQYIFEFLLGFFSNERLDMIGTHVANFFNGIFDKLKAETVGATIAEFFNRLFGIILNFAKTLQWADIGVWISDGLMSFATKFDLNKAMLAISGMINGIVLLIYEAVTNTDWAMIAAKIGEGINTWFNDIDWALLGQTISNTVLALLTLLSDTIATTDWQLVAQSLKTAIMAIDWAAIWEEIKGLIVNAASAITTIFDEIFGEGATKTVLIIGGIIAALGSVVPAIMGLFGAINSVKGVFSAWGTIMAVVKGGLTALGAAIGGISAPIVIAVAAIVAFIAAFADLYKNSESFRNLINTVIDGIKEKFKEFADKAKEAFDKVKEQTSALWQALSDFKTNVYDKFIAPIVEAIMGVFFVNIKLAFDNIMTILGELFTCFMEQVGGIIDILTGIINFITGVFTGDWNKAWNGIKTAFTGAFNAMASTANAIGRIIQGVIDNIINAVKTAVDWFGKLIGKNEEADQNTSSSSYSGSSSGRTPQNYSAFSNQQVFSLPTNIPALATGAVVEPNKEFLALLGDNKHEQEIVAPESAIKRMVKEAITELGGLGGSQKIRLVTVDGKTLLEFVIDGVNKITEQTGVLPIMI